MNLLTIRYVVRRVRDGAYYRAAGPSDRATFVPRAADATKFSTLARARHTRFDATPIVGARERIYDGLNAYEVVRVYGRASSPRGFVVVEVDETVPDRVATCCCGHPVHVGPIRGTIGDRADAICGGDHGPDA